MPSAPTSSSLDPRAGWLGWWPEGGFAAVFDPENGRIRQFLRESANGLPSGARVLDASAGTRPYASLFHAQRYESCDVPDGFYAGRHDFECHLDAIPRPDGTYDAVILTQVLEHVPNPGVVLREILRVLAPGGRLLLSVPLNGPLHGEPWHFFQFTHHGLRQLASETGYTVESIGKIGGAFWFLTKRLGNLPRQIMKQFDPFRARRRGRSVAGCVVASLLLLPFWLLGILVLSYGLRPLGYWLDRLDVEKTLTSGYTAVLVKPLRSAAPR